MCDRRVAPFPHDGDAESRRERLDRRFRCGEEAPELWVGAQRLRVRFQNGGRIACRIEAHRHEVKGAGEGRIGGDGFLDLGEPSIHQRTEVLHRTVGVYERDGDRLSFPVGQAPRVSVLILQFRIGNRVPGIEQIHDALVLGIKDYFQKSGFSKAVLGLSGGIDSALVCALACRALGPENVMAVLMPSKYSSDHSVKDALDLVDNFGCKHEIIEIKAVADSFDQIMAPAFQGLPFNLTEENIQARCRGIVVMAMSNKFGYILLNTSNKSECAVGYGTLYGDMCGAIGVIGDVYKTQVYQLCKHINKDGILIPENSIIKPPSAELRPGQKDSDSLPDYDTLDQILYHYIEQKQSSARIIAQGFDEQLVRRVIKMVNNAEFKRYQTPPILRVSPKAFGMGRRMPIVGKYLS